MRSGTGAMVGSYYCDQCEGRHSDNTCQKALYDEIYSLKDSLRVARMKDAGKDKYPTWREAAIERADRIKELEAELFRVTAMLEAYMNAEHAWESRPDDD